MPDTDVLYCEGWDTVRREASGTMTEAAAAARDRDGAQYAVLLRDSGRPVALLHVAWAAGYLGVSMFDEHARRVQQLDFRVLDDPGRLYWSGFRAWKPRSPHDPEFFDKRPRIVLSINRDGQAEANSSYRSRGGGSDVSTSPRIPAELRTIAKAPFGDWWSYVGPALFDPTTAPPVSPAGARLTADPADDEDGAAPEAARSGWTLPAALGPRHIEALFTPGARLRCGWGVWSEGQIVTVGELRQPGTLRLPTGRVVAADPGFVGEQSEPFTVTVPPGEYPVSIASAACEKEVGPAGNQTTALEEYVTAVRVLIRDEPAATWEMALRPGQDPRMLPAGRFFGFGVDSGTGAFLDAAGRQALRARYAAEDDAPGECPAGHARWAEDPVSGANMVAYNSGAGDGAYPVWIGRNQEGHVVSLVADMLLLGEAELLSPVAASTARYVLPGPAPGTGAGPTAQPASAAALGQYIEELLLVPLDAIAALAVADEPVPMPSDAATFAPRRRPERGSPLSPLQAWPELRFPDRDRAVGADPAVRTHMGHAHMLREVTRRNYNDAVAAYTLAVELAPDYALALGGRGDAFRLLGRNAEALADLTRAIELHPNFSAAYICRARTHYALGRYAEALADYDRFDEIGFTGTGSGYAPVIDSEHRGDICRLLGRYDEALACFGQALDYRPDDAVALSGRGDTLRLLGRHAEALTDLTRAIELDPGLPGAHASRGAVYQALGQDEEARADLARAAELDPGHDPL